MLIFWDRERVYIKDGKRNHFAIFGFYFLLIFFYRIGFIKEAQDRVEDDSYFKARLLICTQMCDDRGVRRVWLMPCGVQERPRVGTRHSFLYMYVFFIR